MRQVDLRVAIVGGGIGGLFAANALRHRGIDAVVFEQAQALGEVGAGVFITPNSVRQLERLGLGDAVEQRGARVGAGSQYYRQDGTPVAPVVTTDSRGWNAVFGMHRAEMIGILSSELPAGVVRTGHTCTGFEQDGDVARVFFANGASAEADVVVGADGIHSVLVPHVTEPSPPTHSGWIAYRGLVARERIPRWPEGAFELWMGQGKHLLVFPVGGGRLLNYVGFVPTDEHMRESWSAPGDPAALAREFVGWDPRVEHLLSQVETTFRWGLYDREPLPTWTRGRLTLLGDAAHPMLPHLGQGANQAIEDGMALAALLAQTDAAGAQEALAAYERIRRERTTAIQRGSRDNRLRYDSEYEDLAIRDAELAAMASFRRWIYDHDVLLDTQAVTASL
jgi:salicylate hydroxylase